MPEVGLAVRIALNAWFVPLHLLAFAFQDRLLHPRSRRALGVARVAVIVTTLVLDDSVVNPSSMVSIALTGVVMPIVCFRDLLRERIAVAGLLVAAVSFAELFGTAVWMVLVNGAATASYAASWVHYGEHIWGMVAAFAALLAWLVPLARAWAAMRSEALHDGEEGAVPLVLAAYPVLQSLGILVLATAIMITPRTNAALLFAGTLPCGLCLVANVAVLSASGKLRCHARMEREAAELSARLDEALQQSEERLATALQLAHFRHDMRNHVQIVASLAARGDAKGARAYAERLAAQLRAHEDVGEAAAAEAADGSCAAASVPHAGRAVASVPHAGRDAERGTADE